MQKILSEIIGGLVSFDKRMAKAMLRKKVGYAMMIIDFVYSGKKDKLLKLLRRN